MRTLLHLIPAARHGVSGAWTGTVVQMMRCKCAEQGLQLRATYGVIAPQLSLCSRFDHWVRLCCTPQLISPYFQPTQQQENTIQGHACIDTLFIGDAPYTRRVGLVLLLSCVVA